VKESVVDGQRGVIAHHEFLELAEPSGCRVPQFTVTCSDAAPGRHRSDRYAASSEAINSMPGLTCSIAKGVVCQPWIKYRGSTFRAGADLIRAHI
jgi:hypothetical protein